MKKGILAAVSLFTGLAGGAFTANLAMKRKASSNNKELDMYKRCYNIMCQWMIYKQKEISLERYFVQRGYRSIAIYGIGRLGSLLYDDLKSSDIEIKYGIDLDPFCSYPGLKIIQPEDIQESVDVIVVTPVLVFDEITQKLSQITDIPVVSIEDLIYEI